MPPIVVQEGASRIGAYVAAGVVGGVEVREDWPGLTELIASVERDLRARVSLDSLRDDPVVRAFRDFFWRIGIDPTKTRPSAEALARRVLAGRGIPRINNVVDAGNGASLELLVPIGLYDLDRVEPPIHLRLAEAGEEFTPIGGSARTLSGGEPVLADSLGILHLFPHRDCRRTMIRPDTRRVFVVACGVPGVEPDRVLAAARRAAALLSEYAGGRIVEEARLFGAR
ncbi:MAG: hypothetical protein DRO01_03460 [Thermoproteota archaeon]|nr:MAG: hypothetical protein DRO01_03460 [Candidatus Korarchaeota archaeon]